VVNRAKDYIDNNILSEPSKRNYFIPKETVLKVADYIKMIGMSGTNIVQLLKIIELPDDIQDMVIYTPPNTKMIFERRVSKRGRKGHKVIKESSESPRRFISIAHAYELARVKDERVERFLLDKVTYDGWTTKHLRSVVDDYINSHLTGEEYFKYFRSKRRIITDLACVGLVRSIINFASTLNSYNIHQVVARASDFKKKEVIIAGMGLRNACVNLKESLDELTLTTRQLLEEKEIRMKEIKSLPFSVILTTSSKDELNPRYTIPSEIMNGLDLKFGDKLILKVVGVERLERDGKPIVEKLLE